MRVKIEFNSEEYGLDSLKVFSKAFQEWHHNAHRLVSDIILKKYDKEFIEKNYKDFKIVSTKGSLDLEIYYKDELIGTYKYTVTS